MAATAAQALSNQKKIEELEKLSKQLDTLGGKIKTADKKFKNLPVGINTKIYQRVEIKKYE